MAIAEQQQSGAKTVVALKKGRKSAGYWSDAWRRLLRNRAAMIGLIIILANVLMAVFAPAIAPKPYDRQVLADNNAAPYWVTQVFPNMRPQEEGGYVKVRTDYLLGAD